MPQLTKITRERGAGDDTLFITVAVPPAAGTSSSASSSSSDHSADHASEYVYEFECRKDVGASRHNAWKTLPVESDDEAAADDLHHSSSAPQAAGAVVRRFRARVAAVFDDAHARYEIRARALLHHRRLRLNSVTHWSEAVHAPKAH